MLPRFTSIVRQCAGALPTAGSNFAQAFYNTVTQPSNSVIEPDMQIGFIGLGNMGLPMTLNLHKHGCGLVVHDKESANLARLPDVRVTRVGSPREVAEYPGLTAIITMLPSTEHVQQVYEGTHGLLTARGGICAPLLIDSSTISPLYTQQLATLVANTPLRPDAPPLPAATEEGTCGEVTFATRPTLVDAPVSGGVPGAVQGTLTFMVGASDEAFVRVAHVLGMMGTRAVRCGPIGAGQAVKLCNNLALAVQMASVAEALALGGALGLDPRTLSDVFNTSSARCWSGDSYNPVPGVRPDVPSSNEYEGGFSTALMVKDLHLALEAAAARGAVTPMAERALQLYSQVMERAQSQKDFSAIYKYVYQLPGGE